MSIAERPISNEAQLKRHLTQAVVDRLGYNMTMAYRCAYWIEHGNLINVRAGTSNILAGTSGHPYESDVYVPTLYSWGDHWWLAKQERDEEQDKPTRIYVNTKPATSSTSRHRYYLLKALEASGFYPLIPSGQEVMNANGVPVTFVRD